MHVICDGMQAVIERVCASTVESTTSRLASTTVVEETQNRKLLREGKSAQWIFSGVGGQAIHCDVPK
jgi:hypothetical protein